MSTFEEGSLRFEKKIEAEGSLLQLEDGHWVYWPHNPVGSGFLNEYGLHLLLDILQRRNAALNAEVAAFFNRDMSQEK